MADRVVLLSIPQLRQRDVSPGALASLDALSSRGVEAELVPAFPGQAASSFATLMTGASPDEHGIVGDTYYDRDERRIVARPLPDSAVTAPRLWDRLREVRPDAKVMLWFAPNSRGAAVDLAAWHDKGSGLATEPDDLAADLVSRFGPMPSVEKSRTGEPPRLGVTAWFLKTAAKVIAVEEPDLAVVRIPYLGQIARRFGPDGRDANRALREVEGVLAPFLASLPASTLVLAVTESVTTPVSAPVFPNRTLLKLGLLTTTPAAGGGLDVDLDRSAAFALADHQICHVYLNDPRQAAKVAAAFAGPHSAGIADVVAGDQRAELGLDHPRAGDVVLVAAADRWFAPEWWSGPAEAPRDPRSGSGLACASPTGLLDPAHVRGSLGAPPPNAEYLGVIVASQPDALGRTGRLTARDVAGIVQRNFAAGVAKG